MFKLYLSVSITIVKIKYFQNPTLSRFFFIHNMLLKNANALTNGKCNKKLLILTCKKHINTKFATLCLRGAFLRIFFDIDA